MFFNKKNKVLPDRGYSYVMDDNGEPQVVYKYQKIFVPFPSTKDDRPCFLNIRRPVVVNMKGSCDLKLPDIPPEADGVLFRNVGDDRYNAWLPLDPVKQVMYC